MLVALVDNHTEAYKASETLRLIEGHISDTFRKKVIVADKWYTSLEDTHATFLSQCLPFVRKLYGDKRGGRASQHALYHVLSCSKKTVGEAFVRTAMWGMIAGEARSFQIEADAFPIEDGKVLAVGPLLTFYIPDDSKAATGPYKCAIINLTTAFGTIRNGTDTETTKSPFIWTEDDDAGAGDAAEKDLEEATYTFAHDVSRLSEDTQRRLRNSYEGQCGVSDEVWDKGNKFQRACWITGFSYSVFEKEKNIEVEKKKNAAALKKQEKTKDAIGEKRKVDHGGSEEGKAPIKDQDKKKVKKEKMKKEKKKVPGTRSNILDIELKVFFFCFFFWFFFN